MSETIWVTGLLNLALGKNRSAILHIRATSELKLISCKFSVSTTKHPVLDVNATFFVNDENEPLVC